jgi:hypothetical protein
MLKYLEHMTTPMARHATYALGQDVVEWLARRREAGCTWEELATQLAQATGGQVNTTYETVRTWLGAMPAGPRPPVEQAS